MRRLVAKMCTNRNLMWTPIPVSFQAQKKRTIPIIIWPYRAGPSLLNTDVSNSFFSLRDLSDLGSHEEVSFDMNTHDRLIIILKRTRDL